MKTTTTTEITTPGSTSNSSKVHILVGDVSHYYDWALEHCSYNVLALGFLTGFGLCFLVPFFCTGLRFILEANGVWQWVVELVLPLSAMLIGFIVAKIMLCWRKKYIQHYKRSDKKEK